MSCNYHISALSIWGSQFEHHLSTGGTIKCDNCRKDICWSDNDAPAYICRLCNGGYGKCCGLSHNCGETNKCSVNSCEYRDSGLSIWATQYDHHLANGGTIKCDNCRGDICWSDNDAPCYLCKLCSKGFCIGCGSINH